MKTITANWYQFPQYYDLSFRSETKNQADFLEAACKRFATIPVRRLLEPACGSGRLVVEMVARGYHVSGFDNCPEALAFLRRKLRRRKLAAEVFDADLANFEIPQPVDAAFCFCNTFRHLVTPEAARSSLVSVANSLRPGGIYVLGLHVMPPDADLYDCERWTESYRGTTVTTTLRVLKAYPRKRLEILRTNMLVRTPTRQIRVRSDYPMRVYTAKELRSLVDSVPQFELCEVFDFWYEIDHPVELNEDSADTVLILRKRPE